MTIGIYSISDFETGEVLYVGQSSNIEERWKSHLKRLRSGNHLTSFSNWFSGTNFNESRLKFEILEECENVDKVKNSLEIKWFRSLSPLYYGKEPSLNETWVHSEKTKAKISWSSRKLIKIYILTCRECGCVFSRDRERMYCSVTCSSKNSGQGQRVIVDKDTLYNLYWKQEMSRAEIGRNLGIGQTTVLKYMKKYGIPRRDTVTALKLSYTK